MNDHYSVEEQKRTAVVVTAVLAGIAFTLILAGVFWVAG